MAKVKIYTKTGDKGKTSLYGGKRVSKDAIRIQTYGTIDELNSVIGVVIAHLSDTKTIAHLHAVQRDLFTIGSRLAGATENLDNLTQRTTDIEKMIDEMEDTLPPIRNFILPGGNKTAAFTALSRSMCRRAERLLVMLSNTEDVAEDIMQYINRLSDYLFVLARYINHQSGVRDIIWQAKTK